MGLKNILFLFLAIITLLSCEKDSPSSDILDQAQNLAESNPSQALDLLNTIANPQAMPEADYMKYIVTLVQIKRQTKENIKNDTLIYSAQQYFNSTDDYRQAALANFYAGWVYYLNEETENSVRSFLQANGNAQKIGNDLVAGRSQNNIGYIYFDQDVMDSAVVYFKKALFHYQKTDNADLRVMRTLTNIGQAYEIQSNFIDASYYYEKGLKLANESKNELYQIVFIHNIGVLNYSQNNFGKATEYFHAALPKSRQTEDSIKLYLNLARVHHKTHNPDSVFYYKNLLKERLSLITDNYTLEGIYNLFTDYYEQTGNHREAAQYRKLEKEVRAQIEAQNQADKVEAANRKYHYMQQQYERFKAKAKEQNIYLVLLSGIIILIISIFIYFMYILWKNLPRWRDQDYEVLWRGYIHSVNQAYHIDHAKMTTRLLLTERKSHFHKDTASDEDIPKTSIAEIQDMLLRNGLYSRKQYLEWAKHYFSAYPDIDKITGTLTNQQLVLFAMCINGFTESEKLKAFNVSTEKLESYHNELELALVKANYLSIAHIQILLYYGG